MARILAVCKDAGGTNGVLPVARELRAMGHTVVFLATSDSPAERILEAVGEKPLVFRFALTYCETYPLPDALLTDMSTGGGVGRDLIPMLPPSCKTFALQDYWGGCLCVEWADHMYRPSYIIVGDNIGAEIVKKAWPEYDAARICVSGFPALDKYAHPEGIIAEAEQMKKTHGIAYVPSVFYAGSTLNGRGLMMLAGAIEATHRKVDLIVRPHSGMKQNEPEEMPIWEAAVYRCRARDGFKVVEPSREKWSTPSLIAAADITVSAYSTVLLEAVMLRKPNITLWTSEIRDAFMSKERGFGGLLDEFPLVTFGCTAKAENVKRLAELLNLSFAEQLGLREAQERHYPNDGLSARRAAEFIHARTCLP